MRWRWISLVLDLSLPVRASGFKAGERQVQSRGVRAAGSSGEGVSFPCKAAVSGGMHLEPKADIYAKDSLLAQARA